MTYVSIIIDGMDQSKTALPHIPSNPKSIAGQYLLPTHLTGVHAHGRHTFVLLDWGQYPHDSNLTITALLKIIVECKVCVVSLITYCTVDLSFLVIYMQDCIPPTLYIQLDNTCRENKNKYVLTFAAMLVDAGIFRKVKLTSLN